MGSQFLVDLCHGEMNQDSCTQLQAMETGTSLPSSEQKDSGLKMFEVLRMKMPTQLLMLVEYTLDSKRSVACFKEKDECILLNRTKSGVHRLIY